MQYCYNSIYSVILSVLDPRKCEYLKENSLDFEHAYMTTYLASWEACRYSLPLSVRLSKTFSSTKLFYTARYLEIFNEFADQLDDDELRNGYFQQDGAISHISNESMTEIESFFDDRII